MIEKRILWSSVEKIGDVRNAGKWKFVKSFLVVKDQKTNMILKEKPEEEMFRVATVLHTIYRYI